ncbi:hypothetical protein QFW80_03885 [Luteimonas sp. M1R5S18]|uniref:Lipoprotein n=1 Tax=Luteimonas rhizosphaericola TaxID=3042024 RepID=A0ABT6JG54_9GAMM|nr:hypothetical protein [Luteimonas rhizosphaericola]MDH5829661.1 hypothetical protein [Luteimonas rhizosphaericola]
MRVLNTFAVLFLLSLTGCATVSAPALIGNTWSGPDGTRLAAQLRHPSGQLPTGWLYKNQQADVSGSFAYHKQSGTYSYSDSGYFSVDPQWKNDRNYFGVLKPDNIFCVANPEQQSSEHQDGGDGMTTITYWTIYDYCAQLHGP